MIEINLLPKELQVKGRGLTLGKSILVPAAAAVVLVVGMFAISFYQKKQVSDLEGKIRIAEARAEQLQRDIEMVDGLVDLKDKITARIDAVQVLDRNRTAWVNIIEDFSGRMPEFLWMTALREVQPLASPGAQAAADSTAQPNAMPSQEVPAELEGYSYSLSGLANLIIQLRKSGHFNDIDLSHAREVELESHPAYSFALSCTIDYTGGANAVPGPESDEGTQLAATPDTLGIQN